MPGPLNTVDLLRRFRYNNLNGFLVPQLPVLSYLDFQGHILPQITSTKVSNDAAFVYWIFGAVSRDPCEQIIPTLGPEVCKYYLHWVIWIPRGCSLHHGSQARARGRIVPEPSY